MQCCFLNKKNHLQIRFLYLRQNLLESLPGGLLSGKRQLSVLSLDDNGKAVCPGGRRRCSYRLDHFFLFCLLFMVVIPFGPAIRWVTLLLLISCGFSDCLSRAGLGGPQPEFGKNTIFCKSSHFGEIGSCRNNYCHCFQIEKHNAEIVLRHEIKRIFFLQ